MAPEAGIVSEETALVKVDAKPPVKPKKFRNDKELANFYRKIHRENAPAMLEALYQQITNRIMAGDAQAMSLAAKILKLAQGDGVTVNVQQNNNVTQAAPARDRYAESIIRRLDARDHVKPKDDAIDAEFVDAGASNDH